jgi:hypothetical protein
MRFALLLVAVATPALASSGKVTASNGVEVQWNSDDFTGNKVFYSPKVKGWNTIRVVAPAGGQPHLLGQVVARVRTVDAVYRGGAPVDARVINAEFAGCRAYCSYMLTYRINVSNEELAAHTEAGVLPIRIETGETRDVVSIPLQYFAAVREAANGTRP